MEIQDDRKSGQTQPLSNRRLNMTGPSYVSDVYAFPAVGKISKRRPRDSPIDQQDQKTWSTASSSEQESNEAVIELRNTVYEDPFRPIRSVLQNSPGAAQPRINKYTVVADTNLPSKSETKQNSPRHGRSVHKMALKLIACTSKARDIEYEDYLKQQQREQQPYTQALDYESLQVFRPVVETKLTSPAVLVPSAEAVVRNGNASEATDNRVNAIRRSRDHKHAVHETRVPRSPVETRQSSLTAADIQTIQKTLHKIDVDLKDARRRGRKTSNSQVECSINDSLVVPERRFVMDADHAEQLYHRSSFSSTESSTNAYIKNNENNERSESECSTSCDHSNSPAFGIETTLSVQGTEASQESETSYGPQTDEHEEFTLEDDLSREARTFLGETTYANRMASGRNALAFPSDTIWSHVQSDVSSLSNNLRNTQSLPYRAQSNVRLRQRTNLSVMHPVARHQSNDTTSTRPPSPLTVQSSVRLNSYHITRPVVTTPQRSSSSDNFYYPERCAAYNRQLELLSTTDAAAHCGDMRTLGCDLNESKHGDSCSEFSYSEGDDDDDDEDYASDDTLADGFFAAVKDTFQPMFQNHLSCRYPCGSLDYLVSLFDQGVVVSKRRQRVRRNESPTLYKAS
jgi:hypothetical protein